MCTYLLDIPRQPTCMKLGIVELYQPIQSCHVICLGISNKYVTVSDRTALTLAGLMLSCLGTATHTSIVLILDHLVYILYTS